SAFVPGGGVTICYEYVAEIERLAPTARTRYGVTREVAVTGAFVQVVLHEMARAVFDVLQVPVWGREADAADKLAGFIMLQFAPGVARPLSPAPALFSEAADPTWPGSAFSDVRTPEAQRFYNSLCIAYGGPSSDEFKVFLDLIASLKLKRARHCAA